MKNLYLSLLSFVLVSAAQAQPLTKPELSPLTRKFLAVSKQQTGQLPEGFVYKKTSDGKICVSLMAKIHHSAVADAGLKSIGAHVGTKAGDIWTLQVPVNKMQDLTIVNGITYVQVDQPANPHLNVARKTTRVDSVHMGYNLPMAYTGKDVVVGVIDFGFDYNHPTFYDTLGQHYRIKRVWELNTNGTPPAGYAYGHEITDTTLIKAQGTDNPEQTHGTAVAGMSSGSGYGGVSNSKFRGMAYESDMVFVGVRRDTIAEQWMTGGFSDFVDGIKYIFDYADLVDKPAVVNISWGSQSGPHDGSNLFNQACNNLSGAGKIIVMSAGNEGQERIHLKKTFTATDTVLHTFLSFTPSHYKRTWVDIWGDTSKTFCAKVTLYSGGSTVGESTGYICLDDTTHQFVLHSAHGTDTCEVEFINATSEYNDKPRMTINVFNHATDSIRISVKGTSGTIDMWDEYYYYGYTNGYQSEFRNFGTGSLNGNTASTVSDMGSAESVLMIGAYASKVNFTDINGNAWSYAGYTPANKLVPFSSRGPLANGVIKPDITAPGLTIATAFSSYDTSYTPTGSNSDLVIQEHTTGGGDKYYFCEFSGTSASAPAASGIVALMLQVNPNLTPAQVKNIIITTAITDVHTGSIPPIGNNNWGHGKINAYGAVKMVLQQLTNVHQFDGAQMQCVVYPNPNDGRFTVEYDAAAAQNLDVKVFDMTGKLVTGRQWQVNTGNNRTVVDLEQMPAGLYTVKVTSAEGSMSAKVLVK